MRHPARRSFLVRLHCAGFLHQVGGHQRQAKAL